MKEGEAMTRRGLALGRQLALVAAVAALALSLSGDRTKAAGVPATIYGQDPLEVLELKVRPNIVLVLDTSSSMQYTQDGRTDLNSADHPHAKLYLGKKVLKDIVAQNQDKVSFWFGTYSSYVPKLTGRYGGESRFAYMASGLAAAANAQLTVQGATNDTLGRGLQAWQLIYSEWNTLYYEEAGVTCVAQLLPGSGLVSGPGGEQFFADGASLAGKLKDRMNNATGCSRQNTYTVTYSASTGAFTFARASGSASWRPR
jgi:hypothetical protein